MSVLSLIGGDIVRKSRSEQSWKDYQPFGGKRAKRPKKRVKKRAIKKVPEKWRKFGSGKAKRLTQNPEVLHSKPVVDLHSGSSDWRRATRNQAGRDVSGIEQPELEDGSGRDEPGSNVRVKVVDYQRNWITRFYWDRGKPLIKEIEAQVADRWNRGDLSYVLNQLAEDRTLVGPRSENEGETVVARRELYRERIEIKVKIGDEPEITIPKYDKGAFDSGNFWMFKVASRDDGMGRLNGGKVKKKQGSGALGKGLDWETRAQMSQSVQDFLDSR